MRFFLSTLSVAAFAICTGVSSHVYASAAPDLIGKPGGIDTGDIACIGQCVKNPHVLGCENPQFQVQQGCYMCCYSDDDAGDFADHIPDDFADN
ncbi:hypothetical protein P175DRAFT_0533085 [Aspergillus ochraceoroseus IBT 24754]|uniref:Uncharacterized protein n=1 Tax=Aspergillus ochraceoroseus IBT 24754 TaxID=1392256 RepID=A0A2T5LV07_9EURO|nr:uncharacterized protein P175DRAFT_0533085 [Aspergillus ochraceoroseus IBT 24754]PTU20110.1 hypothetical protein P175DRAFT_0533085 [Aspergillus ochraceoroseus IBT 24754]